MKSYLVFFSLICSAAVVPTTQSVIEGKVVNVCSGQAWRLVHDGKKVLALFDSQGTTRTINALFCATTEAEVQAEITRLNLTPLPPQSARTKKQ